MSFVHTLVKVTLRERLYEKTGHIALYLDYYPPIRDPKTMKQTRREYLGLYLYAKPTCDALVADSNHQRGIRFLGSQQKEDGLLAILQRVR